MLQQDTRLVRAELLDARVSLLVAERGEVVAGGRSSSSHALRIPALAARCRKDPAKRLVTAPNARSVTLRHGELEARIRRR